MCGLLGIVGDHQPDEPLLSEARDLMAHRGPDDAGLLMEPQVSLAARRLAILDLTERGRQPMTSADGRLAVVFNGAIYNHRALRSRLKDGYPFASQTDTEVLLAGFLRWGWGELLRRIDGMFAVAVWDRRERRLYAARDRAGKKPLFYAEEGGGLRFASTLQALLALLGRTPPVDPRALDAYLTYQAVPAPMTMFQGICQLPPAYELQWDASTARLQTSRYWDVSFARKRDRPEAEVLDDLDGLAREAVRKRLVSDVPLGAFLSGGVDSSLVVAMMAQELGAPAQAVVAGFDDPLLDERPYARQVAQRWGVDLHERVIGPDAAQDLPRILWHYGQPMADVSAVPTYAVAQAAREHVTIVLNGDGGDELFGGYARPMVARAAQPYRRLLPSTVRRLAALGADGLPGPLGRKLDVLVSAGSVPAAQAFVYDRALRSFRHRLYTDALLRSLDGWHPDELYQQVWHRADGVDDVDRALYGDYRTYLPDQLLTKMDVSTMAHGLEARSPLLDQQLTEYAATIPTPMRLRGYAAKYLLKRLAARYVPREVVYRRKQGFVIPVTTWLRGPLAPHLQAALLRGPSLQRGWLRGEQVATMVRQHLSGQRDLSQPLWTLFVLEVWCRLMDGSLRRDDRLDALL